ncbi:DMT family transporter [Myxococcota bacterium]|nr:DMT family transporter [Myxococcota bacterium]
MGELAALASAAMWAIASLVYARLGLTIRALALNLLECTFALLMLSLVLCVWTLNDPSVARWPDAQSAYLLLGSGLIGVAFGDTAYFHSLNRLGPRRSLIVSALTPALTAVLASLFLREAITLAMLLGMALTLGGIFWVIHEKHHHPQADASEPSEPPDSPTYTLIEWRGVAWGLLAAFCQAAGNILTKKGGGTLPALPIAMFRLAAGVLSLFLLVLLLGRLRESVVPLQNKHQVQLLLLATFFGTFLGIWLQVVGLRYAPSAGIASTLSSTSPLFVLPLAFFVLREPLGVRAILGAFFAICGVAILFLI